VTEPRSKQFPQERKEHSSPSTDGSSVDPVARRAVCGGGATWADVDAASQQHALATPGGFISHTGIAGLTLGEGIGWLTKQAGLPRVKGRIRPRERVSPQRQHQASVTLWLTWVRRMGRRRGCGTSTPLRMRV
jgi:hypothetical protein